MIMLAKVMSDDNDVSYNDSNADDNDNDDGDDIDNCDDDIHETMFMRLLDDKADGDKMITEKYFF